MRFQWDVTQLPDIDMDYYDDTVNHYKVAKKDWAGWTDEQKRKFNRIYSAMTRNPEIFGDENGWPKVARQVATDAV